MNLDQRPIPLSRLDFNQDDKEPEFPCPHAPWSNVNPNMAKVFWTIWEK